MSKEMKELCLGIVYTHGADRCGNCPAHEYVDMHTEADHLFTDAGFPDDWNKWRDADWALLEEGIRSAMDTLEAFIWGL